MSDALNTSPQDTLSQLQNLIAQSPSLNPQSDTVQIKPVPGFDGPSDATGSTVVTRDPLFDSPAPPAVSRPGPSLPPPAAMIESAPASAPTPAETSRFHFFTGRSGVGKDFLAQKAGATVLTLDALLQSVIGVEVPATHLAPLAATVFAWGSGVFSKDYPATPARVLFLSYAQSRFPAFGAPTFWLDLLIDQARHAGGVVAITNVSSPQALTTLKAAGFAHWHVMTSPQSYAARPKRKGADDKLAAHFDAEAIRQVSAQRQGAMIPVIWNDASAAPSPRLWTADAWVAEVTGASASAGMSFE